MHLLSAIAVSVSGRKLIEYKRKLAEKHPEVVEVNGKKRYTKIHIHRMAVWKTLTKFVEWLHQAWWDLEQRQRQSDLAA